MKRKKSSKLKNFIVLLIFIGAGVLVYKYFIEGTNTGFNIDTSSSFGVPKRGEKKEVDSQGHTEEFWTNHKFKW